MKWYQKKKNAGIYCNWRSDVDKSTKRNTVKNMGREIKKITTEEEDKVKAEECLLKNLRKNGYKNRNRGKKGRKGRNEEERK